MVTYICNLTLKSYSSAFSRSENQSLDQHERRFAWLWRDLDDFEKKWAGVFPEYWGMTCMLIYEFCSLTRIGCTETLEKYANNTDLTVLMKAL